MPPAWTKDALTKRLEPLVASYFPARGDIRLIVGVHAGGTRYFLTFHGQENGAPVDEDTIFEIGSATMAFTACLLADMVARNQLQLTDPVRNFLPSVVGVPSFRGQDITLLDLANHSSGLPRIPSNFPATVLDPANPCGNYLVRDLYACLSGYKPRWAIGSRREYSNLGMGLLGHVLGLAAHQDYQEALEERICTILGLQDTRVNLSAEQEKRLAAPHSATGEAASNWSMAALVGAGGLRSTARDLLTFLQAHRDKRAPLHAALELCTTPRPKTGKSRPWPLRYGLAAGLAGVTLSAEWHLSMVPATGWFLPLYLTPGLLAALGGGFGPGAAAVLGNTLGAWLLWGERFNGPLHAAVGLGLAWLASSNQRERSRPACLGWLTSPGHPRLRWHSGETGGYASFLGLDMKSEIGVVVLANCAEPVAHVGFRVLDVVQEG